MRRESVTGGGSFTPIERNFPDRVQLQSPGRVSGARSWKPQRSTHPQQSAGSLWEVRCCACARTSSCWRLFRSGNDEAFRVLHDRYRQRLFAYVRQMLSAGSRQDAEDVLQDVFVRAYGSLRNDNRDMNVRAWLYRVAHNRCIDHLRRPVPPPAEIFEVSRKPLHDPVEEAQRRDDLRRLVLDVVQPARAAALGAADARDRRHDVRRPRGRAGRHRARRQVAARPRPDRARRGRRGPRRRLRRDPRRPHALLRQAA